MMKIHELTESEAQMYRPVCKPVATYASKIGGLAGILPGEVGSYPFEIIQEDGMSRFEFYRLIVVDKPVRRAGTMVTAYSFQENAPKTVAPEAPKAPKAAFKKVS